LRIRSSLTAALGTLLPPDFDELGDADASSPGTAGIYRTP
jgi:hypothetical protein